MVLSCTHSAHTTTILRHLRTSMRCISTLQSQVRLQLHPNTILCTLSRGMKIHEVFQGHLLSHPKDTRTYTQSHARHLATLRARWHITPSESNKWRSGDAFVLQQLMSKSSLSDSVACNSKSNTQYRNKRRINASNNFEFFNSSSFSCRSRYAFGLSDE